MTNFKNGSVKISNIIIDQLIAETALRVDGVAQVIGYKNQKIDTKKKDGVVAVIKDDEMDIALTVILNTNEDIFKTSEKIQKSIKEQLKTILGLKVKNVNLIVKEVVKEK